MPKANGSCRNCGASWVYPRKLRTLLSKVKSEEREKIDQLLHLCPKCRAQTFAEKTIASFNIPERVTFVAGDYHADPVPGVFDVAWLSHILHADGPQACATILRKGAEALEAGGLLLVQEFILNDAKDGPQFPALFSLNMLLGTPEGQSYSEGELAAMMAAAGLQDVRRLPVELPNGAGIMAGRKVG